MALTKTLLKLTETEAVVKISGNTADSATIDLQTDILDPDQALSGDTQVVNITGVTWTGEITQNFTITRNSKRVLTMLSDASNTIAFDGQALPPENTENTYDIVVAKTGTGYAELYIKLRKVSGYAPKVEGATFGSYDDPTQVGS